MELLQTITSLILTIGILVTIHEYGHFWVARKCGVKVLRFSVGFGAPIWKRMGVDGTEYVLASIPLGGYVKMFGENNASVAPEERHQSFFHKPLGQRVAIVAAGPLFNLAFAAIAYAALFGYGVTYPKPIVGSVESGSLADSIGIQSGMDLIEIDDRPVRTWEDINLALAARVGSVSEIDMIVAKGNEVSRLSTTLNDWRFQFDEISPVRAFGISPWVPPMEPILYQIQPGSVASKAGLQSADIIKTLNEKPVLLWSEVVTVLRESPGKQLTLLVQRGPKLLEIPVTLDKKIVNGETIGYLGANVESPVWPLNKQVTVQMNPLDSIVAGGEKMLQMSWLTLTSIGKIFTGVVSLDNLSGPITIAKVASASASSGIESFINFLAFISVSLGVLNLLPIPMLDGGHLAFYAAEWVRGGKPISDRIQNISVKIGMVFVVFLMIYALINDVNRLS